MDNLAVVTLLISMIFVGGGLLVLMRLPKRSKRNHQQRKYLKLRSVLIFWTLALVFSTLSGLVMHGSVSIFPIAIFGPAVLFLFKGAKRERRIAKLSAACFLMATAVIFSGIGYVVSVAMVMISL